MLLLHHVKITKWDWIFADLTVTVTGDIYIVYSFSVLSLKGLCFGTFTKVANRVSLCGGDRHGNKFTTESSKHSLFCYEQSIESNADFPTPAD